MQKPKNSINENRPKFIPYDVKITADGKEQVEKTHKQPELVGWVKITQKMEKLFRLQVADFCINVTENNTTFLMVPIQHFFCLFLF